mmetsp:Transcript_28880/g.83825  ORF Transcript_28880/g.83825 Transcript_28880/m.83825 type:complete len:273 (+) Transcript_28880:146-964(+)
MMLSASSAITITLLPLCLPFACIDAFSCLPTSIVPVRPSIELSAQNANDQGGDNTNTSWGALNSKPYVPSGMTAAEFAAIKKRESDEQKSLNFGAFGPRWSRQSRPDGDWMLMRSLWTRGFDSNAPSVDGSGGSTVGGDSVGALLGRLSRNVPVLFVTYLIAVAVITCVQCELGGAAGLSLSLSLSLRSAMGRVSKVAISVASLRTESVVRRLTLPIASLLLIRPVSGILGALNRKRLWSKRRSLCIIAASALSIIYIWAGACVVLSNIATS